MQKRICRCASSLREFSCHVIEPPKRRSRTKIRPICCKEKVQGQPCALGSMYVAIFLVFSFYFILFSIFALTIFIFSYVASVTNALIPKNSCRKITFPFIFRQFFFSFSLAFFLFFFFLLFFFPFSSLSLSFSFFFLSY